MLCARVTALCEKSAFRALLKHEKKPQRKLSGTPIQCVAQHCLRREKIGFSPSKYSIQGQKRNFCASPVSSPRPTLRILFGSQTGNATLLAEQLSRQARDEKGWEVEVVDLHDFNADVDLEKQGMVVFITSCFGRGEPTDNAKDFYQWLTNTQQNPARFGHVKFAVFGLGSSAYSPDRYQAVGRTIDRRLEELGAVRMCPRGEGDDAHCIEDDFDSWLPTFWEKLDSAFPMDKPADSTESVAAPAASAAKDAHLIWVESATPSFGVYKASDPAVIDIRNPHKSPVLLAEQLHTKESNRSVKHLSFDFSQVKGLQGTSYAAGDYLGVYPENPESIINDLAEYLSLDLSSKFELTETGLKEVANKLPFFFPRPCSVHDALKYYCDLTKLPRRALVSKMVQHASGTDVDRLNALLEADKSVFEAALSFKTLPQLLRMFPSVRLDFEDLLELTPALQCRYYSISSSPLVLPNALDLTVVRHRFGSADGSSVMNGLCSTFLNEVSVGDVVRVFVKPTLFKLPEDPAVPILMIGAGTGLAPMRGFIQEREMLRMKSPNAKHGENMLFFGCMYKNRDFIYGNDLIEWERKGIISLIMAFSHDQPERIFVQHRLKHESARVWNLLQQGAHIYVCGAKPMGDGVHEALINIVADEGKMSRQSAEEFLKKRSDAHKYQSDLFD
eukprot:TRINITY_DN11641_c0_g1_i1.p1 TRINITY_DN11641_c0_g1~~TRINITY_DN11641_c0_g1_i1.p1  ORF type:complete len:673 (-),score=98.26 TRINITY_DN11641_c0_g1_i1:100-2118(-)